MCKQSTITDAAGGVLVTTEDLKHWLIQNTLFLTGKTKLRAQSKSVIMETMPDAKNRITVDPEICHGKPTVRGLRYPVSMVLELLAGGMTREEILGDYPDLEPEDIVACLAFAARLSNVQRILPLAA